MIRDSGGGRGTPGDQHTDPTADADSRGSLLCLPVEIPTGCYAELASSVGDRLMRCCPCTWGHLELLGATVKGSVLRSI